MSYQETPSPIGLEVDDDDRRRPRPRAPARSQLLQRPQRRAVRPQDHGRLHVHPEAAAPRGRQDPRALDGPVLARHPAAAGRQGAVRRPALRRDGGVGPRGLRRRLHAAGDAHRQVRRHGRPRQGLRGDRQGREHPRALDPRVVQGAAQGDAVARARRERRSPRAARGSRSARRTTSCCAPPRSSASTSPRRAAGNAARARTRRRSRRARPARLEARRSRCPPTRAHRDGRGRRWRRRRGRCSTAGAPSRSSAGRARGALRGRRSDGARERPSSFFHPPTPKECT